MNRQFNALSLRTTARIAGALYLLIIVSGIFAYFVVRGSLVIPGDPTATAANIAASEGRFRIGLAADVVMLLSDVALAVTFFLLLRPVSAGLSLLAASFRLVQASVLGMNLLNLVIGLWLVTGADFISSAGTTQSASLAMLFFNAHATGYTIGLVFFGVSILVAGYLMAKADYLPTILGVLLAVAGAGYLIDTFANLLLSNYADYAGIFAIVVFVPAIIAELSTALWLLIRGVRANADTPLAAHAEVQPA